MMTQNIILRRSRNGKLGLFIMRTVDEDGILDEVLYVVAEIPQEIRDYCHVGDDIEFFERAAYGDPGDLDGVLKYFNKKAKEPEYHD